MCTVLRYGFKPLHRDTLWAIREKALEEVMNEFGMLLGGATPRVM